ncbi:MAG TPA: OsmC family peroxiredoxin [Myxococcaceae bacterium]|jgi:osmotically inducible protein OsmC|nr:OsmC family peroxiredoxin [Myxococcaceae bacterium]
MAVVRKAAVTWEGDLMKGRGKLTAATSGAFKDLPVTWASRTEAADGRTSPEELVASAHASCFAMAFSAGLARAGTPGDKLEVQATVTFDKMEAGWRIKSSALEVTGWVKGIDATAFEKAAQAAKDGCPISQALKGNVELSVKTTLA